MRHIIVVTAIVVAGSAAGLAQQAPKAKAPAAAGSAAKIRLAMSAAPANLSKAATIVEVDDKMQMKTLRAGTNNWTCMVVPAGPAVNDVMCVDKAWMAWTNAYLAKKDPPAMTGLGVAYMLRGDHGGSNTDPFAEKPTATNQWVVSPAHIMVLVPDTKQLDAMPTDPHNGGPWVMWKGTKYAHVMVPMAPVAASKP
jgi:hypothetical protein